MVMAVSKYLTLAYQFLSNTFDVEQHYYYHNSYRCYDIERNGLATNLISTIRYFEKFCFRNIYNQEHIDSKPFDDKYLDSKFVVFKNNHICILPELSSVLLYFHVFKLKKDIIGFKKLLLKLCDEHKNYFFLTENKSKIVVGLNNLTSNNYFSTVDNYDIIINLLANSNSGFIMLTTNDSLEINLSKIDVLLQNLDKYNFSKINL